MSARVLVSHAEGEESLAEQLARPIQEAGYEVTLTNGAKIFDAATEGPIVLCGTLKSSESGHLEDVLNSARINPRIHLFLAQMERDAPSHALGVGDIFPFWLNFDGATQSLLLRLQRLFPPFISQSLRNQVFTSYCRRDLKWLRRLKIHLTPLKRLGAITFFDDTMIDPGAKWKKEIRDAVNVAKVAILLVSADFLASEFIATNELPPLLAAAENEGAKVIPVIISPSRFEETEILSQFQAINPPSQPLIGITEKRQEETFVQLTKVIEKFFLT